MKSVPSPVSSPLSMSEIDSDEPSASRPPIRFADVVGDRQAAKRAL
ncbi:hypothetical protein [Ensifer canadensis]